MTENTKKLLQKMTLAEKAALVSGHNFMYTNAIPSAGIPPLECSDGPHGLRKQAAGGDNGVGGSEPSTAFPTAATTANSWDPQNLVRIGKAMGEEARYYGVDVVLGPAMNIKRNPLCGRNFEYFSEDPFLTGEMACALVNGLQGEGVGACPKHFAANSNENFRYMGDSVVDERALREIYLKAFERVVKKAHPAAIMCSYNKINGVYASENKWLLTDVLRGEWKFDGIVMTDWGAIRDRIQAVNAGLDLEMPGDTCCRDKIVAAVHDHTLDERALDAVAGRMIEYVQKWHTDQKRAQCDFAAHNVLACEIACDSAVLLKNEGNFYPLSAAERVLAAGELFEKMRYQGSGSSMIQPTQLVTPKDAFAARGVPYVYAKGYSASGSAAEQGLIDRALAQARECDKILIFAGLTDFTESEGADREHMRLPENQLALIDALVQTGKPVWIVLFGGSPVELPFADSVCGILNMYLPGQSGGEAAAQLIFGEKNPAGRLAETWAVSYGDIPFGGVYAKQAVEPYRESIFVGYRYFAAAKKRVRYPFGFGLSYTSFAYRDLQVQAGGDAVEISCTVKNTGGAAGAEVVQVYIGAPQVEGQFFADRELRAFQKVYLQPGEAKRISLSVAKNDLKFFDLTAKQWKLAGGVYRIDVGASVEDIRLTGEICLQGERCGMLAQGVVSVYRQCRFSDFADGAFEALLGRKIPEEPAEKPFTVESRLDRLQKSFFGRMIYRSMIKMAAEQRKQAEKLPDGTEKENLLKGAMFLERMMRTNSARSLAMASSGSMPMTYSEGLILIANGHLFRGLKRMKTPEPHSKLPTEENGADDVE